MKISTLTVLLVSFINYSLFCNEQISLQNKPFYGMFYNHGINVYLSAFSELEEIPSCCKKNMNGINTGFNTGLLAQFKLIDFIKNEFRLGLSNYSGILIQQEDFEALFYDEESDDFILTDGIFQYELDASLYVINISTLGFYELWNKINLIGGFDIGYLIKKDYSYIEKIIKPAQGFFSGTNRSRTRNFKEGQFETTTDLYFSLKLGVDYNLKLNNKNSLFLHPEIFYSYIINPLIPETGWHIHSIFAGLAVKYTEPLPPPPPPLPPLQEPLPDYPMPVKAPDIYADITAAQIDSLGNINKETEIKIEDFVTNSISPLLNFIFFDENSYKIHDRYTKINYDDSWNFSLSGLKKMSEMQNYYNLLNIIGLRLRNNKNAKITLTGTNADMGVERKNTNLSMKRAESVKDYLVNIWAIDPERINIRARNLPAEPSNKYDSAGQEENRRVEIISDNWKITEPIVIKDTNRVVTKTKIRFYPKIISEFKTKKWILSIKQNGHILKEFTGQNTLPPQIDWDVKTDSPDAPKYGGKINYSLKVENTLGKLVSTIDKFISVEQVTIERKKTEKKFDTEYEYYSLILFDFRKFRLKKEHKKILDMINDKISDDSKVIITGHTDIIGTDEFNRKISKSRAANVAKELGVKNVELIGEGEENLLYDNSLPEGRFYCRTVKIMIETKIRNK
jgi:outer membrane protein OmpA-like peptidoglycan-associated protein